MLLKVLGIILGVLLISGGVECFLSPLITVESIASIIPVLIGISILLAGIERFMRWVQLKKAGEKDGVLFAEGILAALAGILMLGSGVFQLAFTLALIDILPILTASLVTTLGIIRIARAIQIKRMNRELVKLGGFTMSWGLELTLGILMIVIGIIGLLNPITTIASVGMIIGMDIITCGVTMICTSLLV